MKHTGRWICAIIAAGVAFWAMYYFGASVLTLVFALLLLSCPIAVIWMSVDEARRTKADIDTAVQHARAEQGQND